MKDNYFVPSFGNRPQNLVGREDIINRFKMGLDSAPGSRERSMLLLGQRGYGKTVLLQEFADIARKDGYVVASPTIVSKDMNMRIVEKLLDESAGILPKDKKKIAGGNVSALGFGLGIQLQSKDGAKKSYAWQLSHLCKELNKHDKPVLILIDEVQASNEELRQLIVAYQEMIGEGRTISLVLAGLPSAVSSVLNDHVLTFLNRATKVELQPLNSNAVNMYFSSAFKKLGVQITDDMIDAAAKATQGSPYMMQLIGHYISISPSSKISKADLEKALNMAKLDFIDDICRTSLSPLSEKDMDFLYSMTDDEPDSLLSDVAFRLGCSSAYAQTYKRRLIQSGVIEQPRRGRVSYAIPYLREFLKKNIDNE
ncbi:MAG: ATP-binding protein [Lachnospiraceae bacterium]|nr:ATP-binding protein [Lachnospiraceae bacterium]